KWKRCGSKLERKATPKNVGGSSCRSFRLKCGRRYELPSCKGSIAMPKEPCRIKCEPYWIPWKSYRQGFSSHGKTWTVSSNNGGLCGSEFKNCACVKARRRGAGS